MKISAPTTEQEHLLYDPDELSGARVIAVLVPGALSPLEMFDATLRWREQGYGLAFYRFPGLDGRCVSPPLNIAQAASEIIDLSRRYPEKPLRLLGYSTGGPIVFTAADQIDGDLKIAAMSSAVEQGGGVATGLRGLHDILRSVVRARSFRLEAIWYAYYRILLFGRAVLADPVLDAQAAALVDARRDRIVLPNHGKLRAHTDDLRRWRWAHSTKFLSGQVRFFWGMADPVFSRSQTEAFAQKVSDATIIGYPGHGHLLFASHEMVFDDVFDFFEGSAAEDTTGTVLIRANGRGAGAGNSD